MGWERIFYERAQVGSNHGHYFERRQRSQPYQVLRTEVPVTLTFTAEWDGKRHVLLMEWHNSTNEEMSRRLCTVQPKADAVRQAVFECDKQKAALAATLTPPDQHTDEELLNEELKKWVEDTAAGRPVPDANIPF